LSDTANQKEINTYKQEIAILKDQIKQCDVANKDTLSRLDANELSSKQAFDDLKQ